MSIGSLWKNLQRLEFNMAEEPKKEEQKVEKTEEATPDPHAQIYEVANRAARSMIAVIDTVTQRGGFKGEELSTIGQLRDQSITVIQLAENYQQEQAQQ